MNRTWFLIFQSGHQAWWVRLLAAGRFHHVMAVAWFEEVERWVLYDVSLTRTNIVVAKDEPGFWSLLAGVREGAVTLKVEGRSPGRRWFRLGFWCVPAVAHLVGAKGCALRPDSLFAQCLRDGAEIFDGKQPERAGDSTLSAGAGAAATGAAPG